MSSVNEKLLEDEISGYLVGEGGYLVCKLGTDGARPQALPEFAGGGRLPFEVVANLKLATVSVRHEITHDLPASNKRSVDDRLSALASLGLTIETPPDKDVTFTIHERLASYDLLYWCWQTVDEVIEQIFAADTKGEILSADRINFQAYQRHPSPEQLAASEAQ
jgi:hypothetical protein